MTKCFPNNKSKLRWHVWSYITRIWTGRALTGCLLRNKKKHNCEDDYGNQSVLRHILFYVTVAVECVSYLIIHCAFSSSCANTRDHVFLCPVRFRDNLFICLMVLMDCVFSSSVRSRDALEGVRRAQSSQTCSTPSRTTRSLMWWLAELYNISQDF